MCLCLHVVIVDACVEKSPHFFKNRVPFCLAAVNFVVSSLKFEFWIVLVSRNRICAAIFFFFGSKFFHWENDGTYSVSDIQFASKFIGGCNRN